MFYQRTWKYVKFKNSDFQGKLPQRTCLLTGLIFQSIVTRILPKNKQRLPQTEVEA